MKTNHDNVLVDQIVNHKRSCFPLLLRSFLEDVVLHHFFVALDHDIHHPHATDQQVVVQRRYSDLLFNLY